MRLPLAWLCVGFGISLSAPAYAQDTKWYDRLRFEGEFRLRHESFFQNDTASRGRLRVRARLGVTAPISSTLTTGVRLATAEPGSVTSHNVTLTGGLTSKNFFLDRAYLTWTPSERFSITGGKFANPLERPRGLMRSELIFDDEVAPEGLHEQVTLVSSREGTVRRFAVMAEQWILSEVSDNPDAWMLGGQGVLELSLGSRVSATVTAGYLGFIHSDLVARLRNANSALVVSNAVVLQDGTVLEGGEALSPSAANPFLGFVNDFDLVNLSAGITIDRAVGRHPLQLYADLVENTGAEDYSTGWWTGLSLGAIRRSGDWSASVLWTRVETDAVLSMYSYSDLGFGGTNVHGPILTAQFRPVGSLTLSYRHHLTRSVVPVGGLPDRRLHRIMFDAGVSF
jgi:hypothetical protein